MGQSTYTPMPSNRLGQPDPPLPANVSPSAPVSGHGSPEGVVPGNPGQSYTDVDTSELWQKRCGTQENGWRKVGVILPQNQGGGGGGGGVTTGNYGGNAPTFTPISGSGSAIDSDTGRIWYYYNSAWHFSGIQLS